MPDPARRRLILKAGPRRDELSYVLREADGIPILYLHGLGSSGVDAQGALDRGGLPGHTFLAPDFPGCGASPPIEPTPTMDELAELVGAAVEALLSGPAVVIGHSMGGLVGLLLATRRPELCRAFVSVEGNLAPEDCFLSRRAVRWVREGGTDAASFLTLLLEEELASGQAGHAVYAGRASREVSGRTFVGYAESIVHCSDHRPLLEMFLGLDMPSAFVHGQENRHLSYLGRLRRGAAEVRGVEASAHFPLYSNPLGFWETIRDLLRGWGLDGEPGHSGESGPAGGGAGMSPAR